jgi:2'-5' RNA ligase
LHFTLHHLGDYPELPAYLVAMACGAAEQVRHPAFDVTLDRIGSYAPGGRPLDMIAMQGGQGVIQLVQFQKELGRLMARVGLPHLVRRRFVPHVTLIYDRGRVSERPIEPIRFRVSEFSLVHSHLGQTEHEVLAKWSLPTHG